MFVVRVGSQINRSLVSAFDRNVPVYVLFWFPIYQVMVIGGLLVIWFLFGEAAQLPLFLVPAIVLSIVIGVPIIMSWHLSFPLLLTVYFDCCASLGLPGSAWMRSQLDEGINWFRSKL